MKILQVNNIVSHHQLPFAKELLKLVGEENYFLAALSRPNNERIANGWENKQNEDWILYPNESDSDMKKFEDLWSDADIVICGERLFKKMQKRLNNNKICFYMSERWWKPRVGRLRLISPKFLKMALDLKSISKSDYFNYLSIGPFASEDIKLLIDKNTKVWQWGYFTALPKVNKLSSVSYPDETELISILWVGRMLKWKKVDLLIKTLSQFQDEGKKFKLTLVGDGPERKNLENLALKSLDKSSFEFKDFIHFTKVPSLMAKNFIYVLPSSGYEGWGAVVNEAMSVGCAVITSDQTGAGASLIDSGINGFLFKSGSKSSLYRCLSQLFDHKDLIKEMSKAAKFTIESEWNPKEAAKRFYELSNSMLNDTETPRFTNGPLKKLSES